MIKRILKFFEELLWERKLSARDMVKKGKWTIKFGNINDDKKNEGA